MTFNVIAIAVRGYNIRYHAVATVELQNFFPLGRRGQ
jgi:hypothetical protein